MILVTGATGMVGGHVLRQLTGQSAPVRALVRSEEKGDTLRGYDCELAVGSYEDAGSLDRALQGTDHVFLISPANEHMAQQEKGLVDAAVRAGSSPHIVKLAAAGVDAPGETGVNFLAQHRRVVEHLRETGLATTVLAPNGFMQNLLGLAGSIQEQGAFFLPAGDAAISLVDARDVAAVAAHVLTSEGHAGATYTVTGSEALTYQHVAERLGAALGKPVRYVDVPGEAARSAMVEAGMLPWMADGLVALNAVYKSGAAAQVTEEVQKATGRSPRTLSDFLADHLGAFRR